MTERRWCEGSGRPRNLSVGEEVSRETYCPVCGRTLKINPTRAANVQQGVVVIREGTPGAFLPRHKEPA